MKEHTERVKKMQKDIYSYIRKKIRIMFFSVIAFTILGIIALPVHIYASEENKDIVPKTYEELTGKALPEEFMTGDAPMTEVTDPGVQFSDGTGSITVKADIPWNIHEQAFVTLTEMNTGEEYTAYLYEANGYETVINVPEGVYVTGGGLSADVAGRFRMSEVYFNAAPYANTAVFVELIDHQEELKIAREKEELNKKVVKSEKTSENASDNASDEISTEEEIKNTKSLLSAINYDGENTYHVSGKDTKDALISMLITLPFAGICFFAYKKYKKNK